MLDVSDSVRAALGESQVGETYAIVRYQGAQARLALESGSFSFDGDGEVQSECSFRAVGSEASLVPKRKTDLLAPYGQEVALFRDLLVRDTVVHTIPLGVYRITDSEGEETTSRPRLVRGNAGRPGVLALDGAGMIIPDASLPVAGDGYFDTSAFQTDADGYFLFTEERPDEFTPGRLLSWWADVSAAGLQRMMQRAKALDVLTPVPGNSMYDEIRRMALIPVQESLPDRTVPADMVYEDRMQALTELAKLVGGVLHITRTGVLTLRREGRWLTDTDPEFDISGTITFNDGMTDEFYNYVVARSQDDRFVGYAAITDDADPLSVNRAGMSTYEHASPLYTSDAAAREGAQTILERLQNRSRVVSVECMPEALLLEVGDFGWMRDPATGRAVLGEVLRVAGDVDPTSTVGVDLIVAEVV